MGERRVGLICGQPGEGKMRVDEAEKYTEGCKLKRRWRQRISGTDKVTMDVNRARVRYEK